MLLLLQKFHQETITTLRTYNRIYNKQENKLTFKIMFLRRHKTKSLPELSTPKKDKEFISYEFRKLKELLDHRSITYHTLRIMTAPPSTEVKNICISSCKKKCIYVIHMKFQTVSHIQEKKLSFYLKYRFRLNLITRYSNQNENFSEPS